MYRQCAPCAAQRAQRLHSSTEEVAWLPPRPLPVLAATGYVAQLPVAGGWQPAALQCRPVFGPDGARLRVVRTVVVSGSDLPAVRPSRRLRFRQRGPFDVGVQAGAPGGTTDQSCGPDPPPEPPLPPGEGDDDPACDGPSSRAPVGPSGKRLKVLNLNGEGVDEELLARLQCDAAFQERDTALIRRLHLRAMEYLRREYDLSRITWAQRHDICSKAALSAALNPTPAELEGRRLGAGWKRQRRREQALRLLREGIIARPRWWQFWKPANRMALPRS
jgi:hypothetical protein